MCQLCLAALVTVLAAAGCYREGPPTSTMPEPHYMSGPPGGAMDPDRGGADPAYAGGAAPSGAPGEVTYGDADGASAPDDPDDADVAAAPPEPMPPAPDDGAQLGDDGNAPGDPGDAMAGVTDAEIDTTLDGYGQWIETDDYGQVWRPDATVVGVDFTPYESGGSWTYTDAGWAFACDYPWGWLPFHYGRWAWFHDFWGWVPGYAWGPAWVEWRHGGGVVGWRPLPPRFRDHRHNNHRWHGGDAPFRDHRRAEQHDAHWRFAAVSDFGRPHIRSHLYGNIGEGLRVTSRVKAPPIRAGAALPARDLMRNRFASGARLAPRPGGFGPRELRDHRAEPVRPQPPGQAVRPPIGRPFGGESPSRGFRPPVYQPPARTYQPPVRTYQPPVRTYQPPVRTYQPPVYHPPASQPYQPPVRTYQPPVYHPPASQPYQPPVRTYQPPVRTYQPPVYHPPASQPSHVWSPPSHASSPPSHAWSPPSHSSSSSSSSSHSSGSSSSSHGGGHHR